VGNEKGRRLEIYGMPNFSEQHTVKWGFFEGENFHEFPVIRENFAHEIFTHNSLSLRAIHS